MIALNLSLNEWPIWLEFSWWKCNGICPSFFVCELHVATCVAPTGFVIWQTLTLGRSVTVPNRSSRLWEQYTFSTREIVQEALEEGAALKQPRAQPPVMKHQAAETMVTMMIIAASYGFMLRKMIVISWFATWLAAFPITSWAKWFAGALSFFCLGIMVYGHHGCALCSWR